MAGNARVLQVVERLPDRATPAERVATLDADIREATSVARKRLEEHASRYTVTGWALDEESWEMAMLPEHMIHVQVRLVRSH